MRESPAKARRRSADKKKKGKRKERREKKEREGREGRRVRGKWRFNYNGRLITAIAHREPSSSRNSRIIRASDFEERDEITDFPADTLDTLENSSPFLPPLSESLCCFTASLPRSPPAYVHRETRARTRTHRRSSCERFQSRRISFSRNLALSIRTPPLRITGHGVTRLIPLRDYTVCARLSVRSGEGHEPCSADFGRW